MGPPRGLRDPAAQQLHRYIKSIADMGAKPEHPEPVSTTLYVDLVRYILNNAGNAHIELSNHMMAAAVTMLFAGSRRFLDIQRTQRHLIRDCTPIATCGQHTGGEYQASTLPSRSLSLTTSLGSCATSVSIIRQT